MARRPTVLGDGIDDLEPEVDVRLLRDRDRGTITRDSGTTTKTSTMMTTGPSTTGRPRRRPDRHHLTYGVFLLRGEAEKRYAQAVNDEDREEKHKQLK
jgi:hypothetical protein